MTNNDTQQALHRLEKNLTKYGEFDSGIFQSDSDIRTIRQAITAQAEKSCVIDSAVKALGFLVDYKKSGTCQCVHSAELSKLIIDLGKTIKTAAEHTKP